MQVSYREHPLLMATIIIFGATGDLCRRKLIPALHTLFQSNLLPEEFAIVGASRSKKTTKQWIKSLGNYPQEFQDCLSYVSADL